MTDRFGSDSDEPVIGGNYPPPSDVPRIVTRGPRAPGSYLAEDDGLEDDDADGDIAAPSYFDDDADEDDAGYDYDDSYYTEEDSPGRQPLFYVFVILAMLVGAGAIYLLYSVVSNDDDGAAPAAVDNSVDAEAQIVSPKAGDRFRAGTPFDVVVNATATEEIVSFELRIGNDVIDSVPAAPPVNGIYTATLRGTFEKRGEYSIYVRVITASGVSKDTAVVRLSANEEPGDRPVQIKGRVVATVSVREGPNEGSAALQTLQAGADVTIIGRTRDSQWLLLEIAGTPGAWVKRDAIQEQDSLALLPFRDASPTPFNTPTPRAQVTPTPGASVTPTAAAGNVDLAAMNAILIDGGTVLRVTIGNLGAGPFNGNIVVSVTGVGADPTTRVLAANLGANQSTTIDFSLAPPVTGQRTANVKVDPENAVKEANEDNNAASFVVSPPASVTPTTTATTTSTGTVTATLTATATETATPVPSVTPTPAGN